MGEPGAKMKHCVNLFLGQPPQLYSLFLQIHLTEWPFVSRMDEEKERERKREREREREREEQREEERRGVERRERKGEERRGAGRQPG